MPAEQGSGGTATPSDALWVSYAQNGEDVRLRRAFRDRAGGRYLEVGAADPVRESVTYGFYRDGWDGIVVEPVPIYVAAFRRQRPRDTIVQAAAGPSRCRATFHSFEGTGLSTLDASIAQEHATRGLAAQALEVDVLPLDEILAETGAGEYPLHFVVIDVEGWEQQVLQGFDLARWKPWVLVVEAVRPVSQLPAWEEWEDLMIASGYAFAAFDGLNRFYVAPDHLDLLPLLETPPSPFDGFTTHDRVLLNEAVDYYRAKATAAEDEASTLRAAVQDRERALARAAHELAEVAEALREQQAHAADVEALASGLARQVLRGAGGAAS